MNIFFNQQPIQLSEPLTLAQLLSQLQQHRPGIAVAIDQQVVPRSQWAHQWLSEGQHIQCFTAIAGG